MQIVNWQHPFTQERLCIWWPYICLVVVSTRVGYTYVHIYIMSTSSQNDFVTFFSQNEEFVYIYIYSVAQCEAKWYNMRNICQGLLPFYRHSQETLFSVSIDAHAYDCAWWSRCMCDLNELYCSTRSINLQSINQSAQWAFNLPCGRSPGLQTTDRTILLIYKCLNSKYDCCLIYC